MLMLKAIFNISMYVCCCLAITDFEIEARIASGARSVEAVMSCTGAGSRCGSCRPEIAQMIADHEKHGVATAPPPSHSENGRRSDGRVHLAITSADTSDDRGGEGDGHRRTDSEAPASAA